LAGWLLTTSRYACANIRRTECRRRAREQVIAMPDNAASHAQDSQMLQMLDEGLAHLPARDREALALRFMQAQSLREVGQALGVSEDAARKRVDRGLEKLRGYFAHRGVAANNACVIAALTKLEDGCRTARAKAHRRTSAYWKRLRVQVLERDGYTCQGYGRPATERSQFGPCSAATTWPRRSTIASARATPATASSMAREALLSIGVPPRRLSRRTAGLRSRLPHPLPLWRDGLVVDSEVPGREPPFEETTRCGPATPALGGAATDAVPRVVQTLGKRAAHWAKG
jgi:hypothetical protein